LTDSPARLTQIKKLDDLGSFRAHVESLGIDFAVRAPSSDGGVLATPVSFVDASAGEFVSPNRFAVLPMEGWDATTDGRPTELVERRWDRFASSGAGLVWGEATAVIPEGRANPNQLVLDDSTVGDFAALRRRLLPEQVVGLQLTHSGRFARPGAAGPAPRIAYRHPLLDARVGLDPAGADGECPEMLSDAELDDLVEIFIDRAVLAQRGGFDFVDIKACHGYLGHELLSATQRQGRYGGDLTGRTNFLRSIVNGIRAAAPGLAVAFRLSIFDLMPFRSGPDGTGEPDTTEEWERDGFPFAFGGDGTGLGIDLAETHALLDIVEGLGIGLVSATAGSPYYCPHVQRPAYFPPSDGYQPPEDPLVGVARLLSTTAEVCRQHERITMVGSGYSYLQQWLAAVGEAVVDDGGADLIGLGRMVLSYPDMAADVLGGRPLQTKLICRTFSDCTTAPRAGLVSGCFPLDPFYKDHPQRVELTQAKRTVKLAAKQA